MDVDLGRQRIERLRARRNRKTADESLHFLTDQFNREVARPFKQLGDLSELWAELVPGDLLAHSRLVALQRGVLSVAASSSARLYELDRLLRSGLERELITRHRGPALRRIRLRVGAIGE